MLFNKSLTLIYFVFFWATSIICAIANQPEVIYVGEVTGNRVNLRTGPHTSHSIVHTATLGQKLMAVEEKDGWVKVLLPEEASVWIHGELVDKISDTIGTVKKDGVNLRVKPSTQTFIMGQANQGQEVHILGEKFGWYKIQSPENIEAWLSKEFFTKLMSLTDYRKQQRALKVQQLYQDIERMHNEELLKPQEQRDYSFLLEKYKYLMDNFSDFPEAQLAEHRYTEVQSWLSEKDWTKLETEWQEAIKSTEEDVDMKRFVPLYNEFISRYPKTVYTDIIQDRLHFLSENPIINKFNVSQLKLEKTTETTLEGVIHDLGKLINRPATHKLVKDGQIVCLLRSEKLNLGDYVYRKVELKGSLIQVQGWDIPILDVKDVKAYSWKGRF